MFQKMKNIFGEINIYGLDFNLLYRKEKTYSTLFDSFLSLIYLSLLVIVSIIYFSEIINNKQFSLVTNIIELNNKYLINLSNEFMMFTTSHFSGEFINFDPTYLTFKPIKIDVDVFINSNGEIERYENISELKYKECSNSYINKTINLDFFHLDKFFV